MLALVTLLVLLIGSCAKDNYALNQGVEIRSYQRQLLDHAQLAQQDAWRRSSSKRSLQANENKHAYYEQLVMGSANLANRLKKLAVMNSTKYDRTRFLREPFDEW